MTEEDAFQKWLEECERFLGRIQRKFAENTWAISIVSEKAIRPFHYFEQERKRESLEAEGRHGSQIQPQPTSAGVSSTGPGTALPQTATVTHTTTRPPTASKPTYLRLGGNTKPVKDELKARGFHWDGQKKYWWAKFTSQATFDAAIAEWVTRRGLTVVNADQ